MSICNTFKYHVNGIDDSYSFDIAFLDLSIPFSVRISPYCLVYSLFFVFFHHSHSLLTILIRRQNCCLSKCLFTHINGYYKCSMSNQLHRPNIDVVGFFFNENTMGRIVSSDFCVVVCVHSVKVRVGVEVRANVFFLISILFQACTT